ncbi:hypothetical protein OSB04_012445 [Centaurea solstitialis]|uniref:Uncharacterized protein n=1 Tax=Centaurea solstitialis TaxID=347529 RepID=A0AA38TM15_9ASTR|nr:hypothetical protein OSB04_012445 [Centaurea solstitialis]
MSKIMKGAAYDSSSRARFKHQTLLQDYLELQQETEAARNKLEAMKQKKQTLEAEVRFLRRRHKFLLKTKSSTPQQFKSQNFETTQFKKSKKEKGHTKKSATLPNLPPIHNLNQRGRVYTEKKNMVPSRPIPVFDMDQRVNLHGVNLNQRVMGNNLSLVNEFNQKEAVVQSRAPIFDLNQISMEEEDVQEGFEDPRKEQHNDLKLSMCRNVGDGSTSRSGKRKISWQDPVALRV